MPQQLTPETRERYMRALAMRDEGRTFREIADACGYADPATARYAWIGGLRLAGRDSEIPARTSRTIGVTVTTNSGRVTRTLTVPDMQAFTTTSGLTFGIELEVVGLTTRGAAQALRAQGIECSDNGYTHAVMESWKVVPDGSLSGGSGSCEVVSPVLRGTDGLAAVRTVMKVLRDAGARVNSSCGMHIHIGVNGHEGIGALTQSQQAAVIKAYHLHQGAFTAFLLERRLNNSYCRFRDARDGNVIADAWRDGGWRRANGTGNCGDRYYAMNLASFPRYGTFEFRAHHGSLNGMNAAAWIALHLAFVESVVTSVANSRSMSVGLCRLAAHNGAMVLRDAHNRNVWTPEQRALHADYAQVLVTRLCAEGHLDQAAGAYLMRRAGNVPTNNRNNNQ